MALVFEEQKISPTSAITKIIIGPIPDGISKQNIILTLDNQFGVELREVEQQEDKLIALISSEEALIMKDEKQEFTCKAKKIPFSFGDESTNTELMVSLEDPDDRLTAQKIEAFFDNSYAFDVKVEKDSHAFLFHLSAKQFQQIERPLLIAGRRFEFKELMKYSIYGSAEFQTKTIESIFDNLFGYLPLSVEAVESQKVVVVVLKNELDVEEQKTISIRGKKYPLIPFYSKHSVEVSGIQDSHSAKSLEEGLSRLGLKGKVFAGIFDGRAIVFFSHLEDKQLVISKSPLTLERQCASPQPPVSQREVPRPHQDSIQWINFLTGIFWTEQQVREHLKQAFQQQNFLDVAMVSHGNFRVEIRDSKLMTQLKTSPFQPTIQGMFVEEALLLPEQLVFAARKNPAISLSDKDLSVSLADGSISPKNKSVATQDLIQSFQNLCSVLASRTEVRSIECVEYEFQECERDVIFSQFLELVKAKPAVLLRENRKPRVKGPDDFKEEEEEQEGANKPRKVLLIGEIEHIQEATEKIDEMKERFSYKMVDYETSFKAELVCAKLSTCYRSFCKKIGTSYFIFGLGDVEEIYEQAQNQTIPATATTVIRQRHLDIYQENASGFSNLDGEPGVGEKTILLSNVEKAQYFAVKNSPQLQAIFRETGVSLKELKPLSKKAAKLVKEGKLKSPSKKFFPPPRGDLDENFDSESGFFRLQLGGEKQNIESFETMLRSLFETLKSETIGGPDTPANHIIRRIHSFKNSGCGLFPQGNQMIIFSLSEAALENAVQHAKGLLLEEGNRDNKLVTQSFMSGPLFKCLKKATEMVKEQFPSGSFTIEGGKVTIESKSEEAKLIKQKFRLLSNNLKTIDVNPQHKRLYTSIYKDDIQASIKPSVRIFHCYGKGSDLKTPKLSLLLLSFNRNDLESAEAYFAMFALSINTVDMDVSPVIAQRYGANREAARSFENQCKVKMTIDLPKNRIHLIGLRECIDRARLRISSETTPFAFPSALLSMMGSSLQNFF